MFLFENVAYVKIFLLRQKVDVRGKSDIFGFLIFLFYLSVYLFLVFFITLTGDQFSLFLQSKILAKISLKSKAGIFLTS